MDKLNTTVGKISRQMKLVLMNLPQQGEENRGDERRRPTQIAVGRSFREKIKRNWNSEERDQIVFQIPRFKEPIQEVQDLIFFHSKDKAIDQSEPERNIFINILYYDQVEEVRQEDKICIPSFSGNWELETFLNWIKSVENFFGYMNTPKEKIKINCPQVEIKGVGLVESNSVE